MHLQKIDLHINKKLSNIMNFTTQEATVFIVETQRLLFEILKKCPSILKMNKNISIVDLYIWCIVNLWVTKNFFSL